jgi:G patch domain-containing protein 1
LKAVSSKGHKRFHGAFEGGFSAGYFNTAGSKEGWTPSEFYSTKNDPSKYINDYKDSNTILSEILDEEDLKVFFIFYILSDFKRI